MWELHYVKELVDFMSLELNNEIESFLMIGQSNIAGRGEFGEVEAIEMGNQIPGQMSVNDVPGVVPENVVEVEGKTVDTDTGEIVGTAGSKVVDLRRREA